MLAVPFHGSIGQSSKPRCNNYRIVVRTVIQLAASESLSCKTTEKQYTYNRVHYIQLPVLCFHADEASVSLTIFICTTVGVSTALAVVVIVGVVTGLTCRNKKLQPSTSPPNIQNHVLPATVSPEYEEISPKDIHLARNSAYGYKA